MRVASFAFFSVHITAFINKIETQIASLKQTEICRFPRKYYRILLNLLQL